MTSGPLLDDDRKDARAGVLSILAATTLWGFSPLFFNALGDVPSEEILAHRILWSLPALGLYVLLSGRRARFLAVARDRRRLLAMALSAGFVSINWFVFMVSIQIGKTSESSFGYYIYPLLAVAIGAAVFDERLSRNQWIAFALAALGVVWMALRFGAPPWIALAVSISFAIYGVIHKLAGVGPIVSVAWEVVILTPFAIAYLVWRRGGAFGPDWELNALFMASALFTSLPLVLFVEATRVLPYSTVGVLFFVNPTLQFFSALILGEQLDGGRLIAFGLIWVAVGIYCRELMRRDSGGLA